MTLFDQNARRPKVTLCQMAFIKFFKGMNFMSVFYVVCTICIVNVKTLYGVQILSPWITELMKQRYEEVGPEGK